MKKGILIILIAFSAISSYATDNIIIRLNAIAFQKIIRETNEPLILDCSTIETYVCEHIQYAISISDIEMMRYVLKNINKQTLLFVYCSNEERSSDAIKEIQELGFTKIYQLKKGLSEWKRQGLETSNN
jgi:rhodanese-related sulfurtransferase